jgi:hypothetical protein
MKFTRYYWASRAKPDRSGIREEWIERVVESPLRRIVQADGRIQLWARIPEVEGRALRVILLEDGETVHNAFLDRRFKE